MVCVFFGYIILNLFCFIIFIDILFDLKCLCIVVIFKIIIDIVFYILLGNGEI